MPTFDKSLGNIGQYQDALGIWQDVDNELVPAVAPWSWQMLKAGYHIKIKDDFTAGQILEFEVDDSTLQLQPMALEWTNDLDQIQQISMPQNVTPIITNPPSGVVPDSSEGVITWENGYGIGRHFAWECTPRRLSKVLTIDSLASLPAPQQYIIDGGNPVLRLNLIFDPSSDMDIYVDVQLWDKSSKAQTFDRIEFRKNGEVLWNFMPLMYWDSEGNEGQSVATLEKRGNKLYVSIRVPYSWLQSAVYPVFIDADVAIETSAESYLGEKAERAGPFWTDVDTGYIIFVDGPEDLKYRKTVDGGANWAAAVNIRTGTVRAYDCWADWQTEGDAGTKIHIVYLDIGSNDIRYVYLDTDGDSVGGDDQIEACQGTGTLSNTSGRDTYQVFITKTRGGNIAVAFKYKDNLNTRFAFFNTSPDASTWTRKNSPWEADLRYDFILLFPGNVADNQDVWATYWDGSANEISLKTFDNSGNSWSEQSISGSMVDTNYQARQMDGQVRLSDGHLIFAAWNQLDNAAADLMVWDINGSGSITAKANVITNTKQYALVSVFVNQINDDIYITYVGGTDWGNLVKTFYQKSVNGGTNWGGQQTMQANAEDDEKWISAGAMKADWEGKFQPVWYNDDLQDLFCNVDNGISITVAGAEIYERSAAVAIGIISTALRNLVEAREASVDVGVAVSALRIKVIQRLASVAIGVAVSAKKFRIYVRQAAVAIGIRVWDYPETFVRNAAVAIGIAVSATRNVVRPTFEASVALGVAVSALRLKRVLRVASVGVGITAFAQTVTIVTKYFRYASVAIGVAVSAARVKVIHQVASVAVGVAVSASRIKGVVRVASVAVGIAVSASRALVILREAAVETGITIASYRKKRVLRKAAVDIGIIAIADITAKLLSRLASVSVGIAVSASRNLALATKSATVEVGIAVSAIALTVGIKIASVAIGIAVSASRSLSLAREASVDIGIDVTALRIKVIHKLAPVAIGIIVSALRLKRVLRVASVEVGIAVSASRALKLAREAVVEIGIAVSALRVKVIHIAALVLIGITAGAQTVTIITKYFRYAAVSIGVAVSASRSIILNRYASTDVGISVSALRIKIRQRWASVAIGVAVSAIRIRVIHKVALVAVGIAVSASRGLILGRFASVAVGVTAWATLVWYRRHLVGTLITTQYRNVQMITTQYRLVQVITAMYRKVKLIIS